jgi:hypothetical protein
MDHPGEPPLDAVDVIAHSTGGLVARTYIQSAAYGDEYAPGRRLPKIDNLILVGVPNRGASKAWNPLHDNWAGDPAFQLGLSKIINRAYQKVQGGEVVTGPDYQISRDSLQPPQCQDGPEICFISQYVPTARALLATYDFIDFGSGFATVNSDPTIRNSLVLDLNAGFDAISQTGDPNAFADQASVTLIYGTNGGETPTRVIEQQGPTLSLRGVIAHFDDFRARDARGGEVYYEDVKLEDSGDGTVPLESSIGQFLLDSRVRRLPVHFMPFTRGVNTQQSVGHTALMSNPDVQRAILRRLGVPFNDPADISVGRARLTLDVACAVTGCTNFILDPVEGFLVDAQGRRLGFSTATGPVTEIPNSVWFGNADGIGWVSGPVEEPLTVELSGLGEEYYVMVSSLSPTGATGVVDRGVLAAGQQKTVPVTGHRDTTGPTIALLTPADGATFVLNQAVQASYTCADEAGGSGLAACDGTTPAGTAIDTASLGPKSFTVAARDAAGNTASVTHTYTVVPPAATSTTHCSILGNDRPPSRLDQDVFAFDGRQGERVVVTLAADPARTHRGGRATVLLVDHVRGAVLARLDASALPNELRAPLPATGRYLVVVAEQPAFGRGSPFRGGYCVRVESSGDAHRTLRAHGLVE